MSVLQKLIKEFNDFKNKYVECNKCHCLYNHEFIEEHNEEEK